MTAPARITQADMERATKSVAAAGYERARIIMRLEAGEIEIIIGDLADSGEAAAAPDPEEWSDDDV